MNTKEITAFIAEELSWKKLYYDKLLPKQKFLCCVVPFLMMLGFIVFGTGALHSFHSWLNFGKVSSVVLMFTIIGLSAIVAGLIIDRKYRIYEKMVFEQEYRSPYHTTMSQVRLSKLATFLGEHNTEENRAEWLKYYSKKTKHQHYWVIGVVVLYPLLINILKPKPFFKFYVIFFGIMLLFGVLMVLSGTRYRPRAKIYNEAKDLLKEISPLTPTCASQSASKGGIS